MFLWLNSHHNWESDIKFLELHILCIRRFALKPTGNIHFPTISSFVFQLFSKFSIFHMILHFHPDNNYEFYSHHIFISISYGILLVANNSLVSTYFCSSSPSEHLQLMTAQNLVRTCEQRKSEAICASNICLQWSIWHLHNYIYGFVWVHSKAPGP